MSRAIQWLGIRLPKSHPTLARMYATLSETEREALDAVESAGSTMALIPGVTSFQVGPQQGFSKSYKWTYRNRYVEVMTDSDAALLMRGGIIEWEQFRDTDRPDHRDKQPPYPSKTLMENLRIFDPKSGQQYTVTQRQARTVARLLRSTRRVSFRQRGITTNKGEDTWYPEVATSNPMFKLRRIK